MTNWRPVPGFEGLYQVSDSGEVLSTPRLRTRGGILKQYRNSKGYPAVTLHKNGKQRRYGVHQLVALAFFGPRPDGQEVRHLDGNPQNRNVTNLAYGTRTQNGLDRVAHGRDRNASKTHCAQGHEYTPENTRIYRGGRVCRKCANDHRRRWYEARRARGLPSVVPVNSPEQLARQKTLALERSRRYKARKRAERAERAEAAN